MSQRLEQLLKLNHADPSDPFVTYGIALEHAKDQRLDEAIHWLDRTLHLDPAYFYAYFQKAKLLGECGEADQARRVLEAGMTAAANAGDDHARGEMSQLHASLS